MKKRTAVISITIFSIATYVLFPRFDLTPMNNLAYSSLDEELICTEPYSPYKQFGTMLITSPDGGKTLNVTANEKSFLLVYSYSFMIEDFYKNNDGQTFSFDGEIYHDGFFGNHSGKCN